jgi:hypothetical protein
MLSLRGAKTAVGRSMDRTKEGKQVSRSAFLESDFGKVHIEALLSGFDVDYLALDFPGTCSFKCRLDILHRSKSTKWGLWIPLVGCTNRSMSEVRWPTF